MHTLSKLASCIAFIASTALPNLALANDQHRYHAAHVHGEGQLNLAQEGQQLHLELSLPAHDALGFESINTPEQQEALQDALNKLKSETLWIFPDKANCRLLQANANTANEQADDHDEDHHDEDHHDDDDDYHEDHHQAHHDEDHHDDDDHDDHEDHHQTHYDEDHHEGDHHDEDHHKEKHLDLHASYTFQCKNPEKISQIGTRLFDLFGLSDSLKLQGLTDRGQSSGLLTRENPEVKL